MSRIICLGRAFEKQRQTREFEPTHVGCHVFGETHPVDFEPGCVHSKSVNYDISHLLNRWEFQPGEPMVRRFKGKDGMTKIQLRIDLGLLQMNAVGRPDGQRPRGCESLLEYHQAALVRYVQDQDGTDTGFKLDAEACAALQLEAIQYHHRYLCLFQLEDYEGVLRDTQRNFRVFDLVERYAENDDLVWIFEQFRPQLFMMRTRAKAAQVLASGDFAGAIVLINAGIEELRAFYREQEQFELEQDSDEIASLEAWLEDIQAHQPLSRREKLEMALKDAIQREDYEKAARFRDALRKLKPTSK